MPSGRVVEPGEVYLNGRFYRLVGQVRRSLVSQLPPKVTLGEFNEASNPIASSITWSDLTGGMGKEIMQIGDPPNQVFWADANLSNQRQAILNFWTSPLAQFSTGQAGVDVRGLLSFSTGDFYATSSSRSGGTPTTPVVVLLGTSLNNVRALADPPKQILAGQLGSDKVMVVPTASNLDWSTNPFSSSAWNRNTTDISYAVFWRDLLWGVNSTARSLQFTADLSGAWTQTATFFGDITPYGLLVAPAADGQDALYVVTDQGLFIYDSEAERFAPTALERRLMAPDGKIPSGVWRKKIYVANRTVVYEYIPGLQPVVNVLAPFPAGISSVFDVPFRHLVGDFHSLYALAASTAGTGSEPPWQTLYRYDGRVWHIVVGSLRQNMGKDINFGTMAFTKNSVSSANVSQFTTIQLGGLTTETMDIAQIAVPLDTLRPLTSVSGGVIQLSNAAETYVVLPWLLKEGNQDWLALEVLITSQHANTSNRLAVDYGLNLSDTWASLGSNSTTGDKTFPFPVSGDQVGTQFSAIRFRVLLTGEQNGVNEVIRTPILNKLTLTYLRKPRTLWGFDMVLDLTEDYKGYSPKQQREAIETAITSTPLVEFTYRDESDNTENHFVQVLAPESLEDAGRQERNTYRLRLTEAI